jgi:type IV fimbrial biogenesis protein FimT
MQKGFSLLELLTVLVIAMTVMMLGLPSMKSAWVNQQVRSSADGIMSGLQLAKSEAMKRNARVYFFMTTSEDATCVLSQSGRFWVVGRDVPTGACQSIASETSAPRIRAKGRALDTTGKITAISPTGHTVGFNGSGFVIPNADGSASMTSLVVAAPQVGGTTPITIQVAEAGRIKMCLSSAPAGDPRACD